MVKQTLLSKATVVRLELVRRRPVVALTSWVAGRLFLAAAVMDLALLNCIKVAIDLTLVEMVPAVWVLVKQNLAGLVVMVAVLELAGEKWAVMMI